MPEDTRIPTAIYGRTSRDDPRTVTIEIQQQALRNWAKQDPHAEVVAEYWDDGISGTIPLWDRPAGKALIADVMAGRVQSVAVVYADRFGRTLLDGLLAVKKLESQGVKILAIHDGWDARRFDSPLYFQFRMMLAEEDHRRIIERLSNGKLRAMDRDNAPPGGPLTFGYRMDEHGRYVLDPVEAPIVVRVFELCLEGWTNNQILTWVKGTGVPAGRKFQKRMAGSLPQVCTQHQNARWHLTKIGKILRCKTYLGERTWGERVFPCPQLIDPSSFDRVQILQDAKQPSSTKGDPDKSLLSGLFTCSLCGRLYHRHHRTTHRPSGKVEKTYTYTCDGLRHPRPGERLCKGKIIPVAWLDRHVWATMEECLRDPEGMIRKVIQSDRNRTAEVTSLDGQISKSLQEIVAVENQIQELWAEQDAKGWPLSVVSARVTQLSERRKSMEDELKDLRRQHAAVSYSRDQSSSVLAEVARLRSMLDAGLSPAEKFAFIRRVWAGGVVRTIGVKRSKTAEITFEFKWGELVDLSASTQVPKDCGYGTKRDTTLSFTIHVGRKGELVLPLPVDAGSLPEDEQDKGGGNEKASTTAHI